jgi:hypothetical protein
MNLQSEIVQQIIAHLNGELSETILVAWVEQRLMHIWDSDEDFPNEEVVISVLS